MNRIFRTTVLSAAVLATTLATLPAAARDRYGRHEQRRPHHERTNSDADLVAVGILGLAVGAIVMGALAQPEPKGPVYRGDPLDDTEFFPPAPPPVNAGASSLEPWSAAAPASAWRAETASAPTSTDGGFRRPSAAITQTRNGFDRRSSPKRPPGPCPQMKPMSSPSGNSFSLMDRISAA